MNRIRKGILSAAIVISAVLLVFLYLEKRSYRDYKVLLTSEQEDIISTNYVEMDGKILRYSPEGVSLISGRWSLYGAIFTKCRIPLQM